MNILLTGGSRGLGLEIARQQLSQGHSVVIVNRDTSDALQSLLDAHPDRTRFIGCDLADPTSIADRVFGGELRHELPIHALVNNAASAYDDLISNLEIEPLERMFRLNVYAPMVLVKYAIRNMLLHNTAGSIVHISSISAHTGYKGLAMYAATKGAIESFSRTTAHEWGRRGIRSNCVVAGFMDTALSSTLTAEEKSKIHARTALGQATEPRCVAAAVDFLLSERSASMTGQNLHVDAGAL